MYLFLLQYLRWNAPGKKPTLRSRQTPWRLPLQMTPSSGGVPEAKLTLKGWWWLEGSEILLMVDMVPSCHPHGGMVWIPTRWESWVNGARFTIGMTTSSVWMEILMSFHILMAKIWHELAIKWARRGRFKQDDGNNCFLRCFCSRCTWILKSDRASWLTARRANP